MLQVQHSNINSLRLLGGAWVEVAGLKEGGDNIPRCLAEQSRGDVWNIRVRKLAAGGFHPCLNDKRNEENFELIFKCCTCNIEMLTRLRRRCCPEHAGLCRSQSWCAGMMFEHLS